MFDIGKRVSFTYLKDARSYISNGYLLSDEVSNAQHYTGVVEEVRDITDNTLSNATWRYGKIKGSRSQNLVTVKLDKATLKSFMMVAWLTLCRPSNRSPFVVPAGWHRADRRAIRNTHTHTHTKGLLWHFQQSKM